jgi:carboxypeptidase family protein
LGNPREFDLQVLCQGRRQVTVVIMCRVHLVLFAALIAFGSAPVNGAAPGSVSGLVRDTAGVPQIGAVVQLLRPDLIVIASVYTNGDGRFTIPSVLPGRYAIKAMGTSFLPSLHENVRVRTSTVVNLTLSTLYEVMQWLPSEPRAGNAQQDDWAWTLRSAANRPLLRWLEDGPLVVVFDGSSAGPKLKARLMATGQEGTFGESGERISASVEETPSNSRELLASVDFAPNTDAGMESMLGFRQDLGFAGSVQSVAAVAIHPEIDAFSADGAAEDQGLDEAAICTSETLHLGDEIEAEVGSTQMLARFGDHTSNAGAANTVAAALPFATVGWRDGDSTVRYRMTTSTPGRHAADETEAQAWLPQLSARNGDLVIEHGLHQEVGWERRTEASSMAVLVFNDSVDNPVIEAMSHFATGDSATATVAMPMLFDSASGLIHAAGPDYSTTGMLATVERRLPGANQIRISYANGDALVIPSMTPSSMPEGLADVLATAHPRRAQTYSISLSGTLDGTGTRWRASYRWQPDDTVTGVAPFAANAAEPYLNLHLRQTIHLRRDGTGGIEGLLDLRNLLAEGYRPYLLSDGSLLIFAQDQRSIGAGLAFTF